MHFSLVSDVTTTTHKVEKPNFSTSHGNSRNSEKYGPHLLKRAPRLLPNFMKNSTSIFHGWLLPKLNIYIHTNENVTTDRQVDSRCVENGYLHNNTIE